MRVMVVVCGANAERSVILEKAVEEFANKYFDRIIQVSACTVAASSQLVQMSGGTPSTLCRSTAAGPGAPI
jgi:galactitol-specific phosphotransferase system IIB component